ncbi:hypothetical protein SFC79_04325 [Nocardioides sp. S-58]|uniref:Oxidoreductase n=1 Tax=Nocardioides renjunii TaxID=3095075 RepID=A0ABU5K7N9_9ACTN|nr:hypothetical protein [Nocardioides sp. S-58]MDZ5660981.1 hypothetical protein [Nocardioides sp. S-58]
MVDSVLAGRVVDLGACDDPRSIDDAWWATWHEEDARRRQVRGEVFSDLVRGRYGEVPTGLLRLRGLYIAGDIDLDDADLPISLMFEESVIDVLRASRASLRGLGLFLCRAVALNAYGIHVQHGLWLTHNRFRGLVTLSEAHVGEVLELQGARLDGGQDPTQAGSHIALQADGVLVGSVLGLRDGFFVGDVSLAYAEARMIHLQAATILDRPDGSARLDLTGIKAHEVILNDTAIDGTIDLGRATIDGALHWGPRPTGRSRHHAWHMRALLTQARVGALNDRPGSWPRSSRIDLNGLRYDDLGRGVRLSDRLAILPVRSFFHTQPYEQLASLLHSQGQEADARRVLKKRERERTRARRRDGGHAMGLGQRVWRRFFGLTLGYGYQPWRAALLLVAAWLAAALLFGLAADGGAMVPTEADVEVTAKNCDAGYPCFDSWLYASDVVVPIIKVGQEDAWRIDASSPYGDALAWAFWTVRVLGWAAATLAIASLTGLVRSR